MAAMVLENIRVDFPIYGTQRNLRTALFERATGGLIQREGKNQERVVVKALVDVSMKLEEGDRLALIGHNGSGKSTLLKVMAGIYEPIAGRVLVEGRVTPLFDMMPGLDHEDNAYENIFTAGLLIGMSHKEIERKIPQIEEFCELGEYLSLPVRTYSAGMVARLGFALSTALDPGILLMDEGIGAGDARFAERAAKRMKEFLVRSSIIVLASHNAAFVKSICNKAALMDAGRIVALGEVDEIFDQYHGSIYGTAPPTAGEAQQQIVQQPIKQSWPRAEFTPATPMANQFAQCLGGGVETPEGVACGTPSINLPFNVCLRYRLLKDSPFTMIPNFHFIDGKGETLLVSTPLDPAPTGQGDYVASCIIDPFVFNAGRYSVALALSSMELAEPVHFYADALRFEVVEPRGVDPRRHGYEHDVPGVMRTRLAWQIKKAQ
jgi:ABC-type polysaccharide/polyol phosphate transport system ATPase subunit